MMILTSFLWYLTSLFSSILHMGTETEATVERNSFEQGKHRTGDVTLVSWPCLEQGYGLDDFQELFQLRFRFVSCSVVDMSP